MSRSSKNIRNFTIGEEQVQTSKTRRSFKIIKPILQNIKHAHNSWVYSIKATVSGSLRVRMTFSL